MSIGRGVPTSNGISIRRIHMTGFSYALDYSDRNNTGMGSGSQDNVISECVLDAPITTVYVSPLTSAGQILNQKFVNNTITKGQDSTDGSPIVYIDSNGGESSNIWPIDLLNNTIFSDVTGGTSRGTSKPHACGHFKTARLRLSDYCRNGWLRARLRLPMAGCDAVLV